MLPRESVGRFPARAARQGPDRLAFHGCISAAGPVATGIPEDTVEYCRRTPRIMMPNGGYCFAPTHQLQDNTPTRNAVAMYETGQQYGIY